MKTTPLVRSTIVARVIVNVANNSANFTKVHVSCVGALDKLITKAELEGDLSKLESLEDTLIDLVGAQRLYQANLTASRLNQPE